MLFDLQISQGGGGGGGGGVFIPQVQRHAQSLFLFPIVFGINLFYGRLFGDRTSITDFNKITLKLRFIPKSLVVLGSAFRVVLRLAVHVYNILFCFVKLRSVLNFH